MIKNTISLTSIAALAKVNCFSVNYFNFIAIRKRNIGNLALVLVL